MHPNMSINIERKSQIPHVPIHKTHAQKKTDFIPTKMRFFLANTTE